MKRTRSAKNVGTLSSVLSMTFNWYWRAGRNRTSLRIRRSRNVRRTDKPPAPPWISSNRLQPVTDNTQHLRVLSVYSSCYWDLVGFPISIGNTCLALESWYSTSFVRMFSSRFPTPSILIIVVVNTSLLALISKPCFLTTDNQELPRKLFSINELTALTTTHN